MAISLDTIFQPFNAFFVQKFSRPDGETVSFRFAQLPIALYDSDLVDPLHPDSGPLPALGAEHTSFIVDGLPRLDAGGRTVWLDPPRISDLYHDELLSPAQLQLSAASDPTTVQQSIDAFSQVKSDALKRWENCKAASLILNGTMYRPVAASPVTWWNKNDTNVWTHQQFVVQAASTQTTTDSPPILKRKVTPDLLQSTMVFTQASVAQPSTAAKVALSPAARQLVLNRNVLHVAMQPVAASAALSGVSRAAVRGISVAAVKSDLKLAQSETLVPQAIEMKAVPLSVRVGLDAAMDQQRPVQPVQVATVTISFDYCLVNITRPWVHNAMLDRSDWYVPGIAKGALSRNDGHGAPALPVGFVALKNLRISAPWTPDDISNLEQSSQFGPFNFDSRVVDGAIGHDGIQVVGFLLADLPDLPPQNQT